MINREKVIFGVVISLVTILVVCFMENISIIIYLRIYNVLKKYPSLFSSETLTIANIKWLYTHLVTRSFGCHL